MFDGRLRRVFSATGIALAALILFGASDSQALMTVLVNNDGTSQNITKYDFDTGTYLGLFTTYSMQRPLGMTVDNFNNVYVADINANTIEKFDAKGTHLATFTSPNISDNEGMIVSGGFLYSASYNTGKIAKFALNGTDLGIFANVDNNGLQGLVADVNGNLYVADYNGALHGGTIQKVTPDGSVSQFATMATPIGLTIDSSGNIYGSDPIYGHVIHKFSPSGADLGVIVSGAFAYYMTTGTNDFIYAPLTTTPAIEKYSTSGTDLGAFTTTGLDSPVAIIIIPEPSSFLLLATGAVALAGVRRRKH